jgi:hypothetical protein
MNDLCKDLDSKERVIVICKPDDCPLKEGFTCIHMTHFTQDCGNTQIEICGLTAIVLEQVTNHLSQILFHREA